MCYLWQKMSVYKVTQQGLGRMVGGGRVENLKKSFVTGGVRQGFGQGEASKG